MDCSGRRMKNNPRPQASRVDEAIRRQTYNRAYPEVDRWSETAWIERGSMPAIWT